MDQARTQSQDDLRLPVSLVALVLASGAAALVGGYWDDAWHTERGRDQFFIPPHILIYGGITLAGAALGLWLVLAVRRRGLREALGYRPLALALLSVAVTLVSGPIDNAWHLAFGRDAVIWSPPHVFGILGTAGLGVALLAELGRRPERFAMLLRPLAGGLTLAAFNFLVIEYETDVPQFDPLWYLPVLSGLAAFALGLIQLIDGQRVAAGKAAAAHLGFVAAVAALLLALGYDAPKLPLLLGPALVLDLTGGRLSLLRRALLFELVLFGLYVLSFDAFGSGVRIDSGDVLLGFPIGLAVTAVVLFALLVDQGVRLSGGRTATATGLLLLAPLLVVPSSALAHDPGQGSDRGTLRLVAKSRGHELSVQARPSRCQDLRGGQLVARRAGQELRAPLMQRGCQFSGRLRVSSDGRWFAYADLRGGKGTIESWLPLKVGDGTNKIGAGHRYAYLGKERSSGAAKLIGGLVLYVLALAFLIGLGLIGRGEARPRGRPATSRH